MCKIPGHVVLQCKFADSSANSDSLIVTLTLVIDSLLFLLNYFNDMVGFLHDIHSNVHPS